MEVILFLHTTTWSEFKNKIDEYLKENNINDVTINNIEVDSTVSKFDYVMLQLTEQLNGSVTMSVDSLHTIP